MNMPDNERSIVFSGEAGQGLNFIGEVFVRELKNNGYHVFSWNEYMSRVRGGNNSLALRISNRQVKAYINRIDIFVALNNNATERFRERITPNTMVLADEEFKDEKLKSQGVSIINIPIQQMAKNVGGILFINSLWVGILSAMLDMDKEQLINVVLSKFANKDESIKANNKKAIEQGYDYAKKQNFSSYKAFLLTPDKAIENDLLLTGNEAVSIGALLGGCNFVSSYPMSPSTEVLTFMAAKAKDFGIIVEQAEDEIAAINMAQGAWYAGARAMVTTAGGGFALMVEGLSLAGCIESPLVIHLAQRPAPATGLPTRTEQSDLEFAIHAGHGEFPRLILAPGNLQEAITLSCKAFILADKYQIPVILLTDQYILEQMSNESNLDTAELIAKSYIIKTEKDYQRYKLTADGISPRGIPGYGKGKVCVDSDEHNESGYITESSDMRIKMVNKRLQKFKAMQTDEVDFNWIGNPHSPFGIIGWGSTDSVIFEALEKTGRKDIAYIHCSQVYPLPSKLLEVLKGFKKTLMIENNATGQFARVIRANTGFTFHNALLQYDGFPFSVETVLKGILDNFPLEEEVSS